VVAVVGIGLPRRLLCLCIIPLAEAGLRQTLARHGHQQRVGRLAPVLQCQDEVAAGLAVVAHALVELTHVVIEDAGGLCPSVFLEDGQRLLVVGNGQVGLVAHVVEVGNGAIEGGVVVVDVALLVPGVALH